MIPIRSMCTKFHLSFFVSNFKLLLCRWNLTQMFCMSGCVYEQFHLYQLGLHCRKIYPWINLYIGFRNLVTYQRTNQCSTKISKQVKIIQQKARISFFPSVWQKCLCLSPKPPRTGEFLDQKGISKYT